jgi:heat-inducible transcriptional repressor
MTTRQKQILQAIIEKYTKTAQPVSSLTLQLKYGFDISPATIRAEMNELEKQGYIYQPHTSAGRIPTDQGYRFFVNSLIKDKEEKEISQREKEALAKRLHALQQSYDQMIKEAAQVLSYLTYDAALATLSPDDIYYCGLKNIFAQPEFQEIEKALEIAEIIDRLDEFICEVSCNSEERKIYIGEENPLGKIADCSVIISGYKISDYKHGWIGILGPTRMSYSRNLSLVSYVAKILSEQG